MARSALRMALASAGLFAFIILQTIVKSFPWSPGRLRLHEASPTSRPIDLREPICITSNEPDSNGRSRAGNSSLAPMTPCSLSVDIMRPVIMAVGVGKESGQQQQWSDVHISGKGRPSGPGAQDLGCKVSLMPWSPFPCTYDTTKYNGTSGQRINYCDQSHLFVTGRYHADLPHVTAACSPSFNRKLRGGARLHKVVLALNFKVAEGRQFDRTYNVFINDAVVGEDPMQFSFSAVSRSSCMAHYIHTKCHPQIAFGTTTEPSRWGQGHKHWSVDRDITHLQVWMWIRGEEIIIVPGY